MTIACSCEIVFLCYNIEIEFEKLFSVGSTSQLAQISTVLVFIGCSPWCISFVVHAFPKAFFGLLWDALKDTAF